MRYRSRRNRDPHWITARWDGQCAKCGGKVVKNQRAFYYPATRSLYCQTCGQQGARDFEAAAFDEAVYAGRSGL